MLTSSFATLIIPHTTGEAPASHYGRRAVHWRRWNCSITYQSLHMQIYISHLLIISEVIRYRSVSQPITEITRINTSIIDRLTDFVFDGNLAKYKFEGRASASPTARLLDSISRDVRHVPALFAVNFKELIHMQCMTRSWPNGMLVKLWFSRITGGKIYHRLHGYFSSEFNVQCLSVHSLRKMP